MATRCLPAKIATQSDNLERARGGATVPRGDGVRHCHEQVHSGDTEWVCAGETFQIDGGMDGWMDGWMGGWTGTLMGGWMLHGWSGS